MIIDDFDKDGILDILAVGNLFDMEVVTPRNDASIGVYLKGDGKEGFNSIPVSETGFFAPNDAKSMALVKLKNGEKLVLVGNNNSQLQVFKLK